MASFHRERFHEARGERPVRAHPALSGGLKSIDERLVGGVWAAIGRRPDIVMTVPTPSPPRRQRRLMLLALVAGAFLARRYLIEIGPGLRPLSRPGIEGFLRYVCGDYTGAAAAYRDHLRDLFATAGLPVDNEEVALLQGDTGRSPRARSSGTRAHRGRCSPWARSRSTRTRRKTPCDGSAARSMSPRTTSTGSCSQPSRTHARATPPRPCGR